jgi:hypothetical protein
MDHRFPILTEKRMAYLLEHPESRFIKALPIIKLSDWHWRGASTKVVDDFSAVVQNSDFALAVTLLPRRHDVQLSEESLDGPDDEPASAHFEHPPAR